MPFTFDLSKDEIAKLCRYFETNRKSFFAPGVKEAHVRQSLIDPFFENLGWDVRNSSRIAPQYREVVPEDSLDVEGHQKAPDYTFRVGTTPKFYAEAKKCGVNINVDLGPAYQLRRYAYSAKLDLSILTDFEEFSVYECSSRPKPRDKASHSRIHYYRFEEYPDRWKEIWDIFSREAVWAGSFDQYISSKRKRGTSEVDTEFLKDIESWRETLARNFALRNPSLGVIDLNAAVQRTIDRIIFLRIAEDRGLEPYQQLLKLCEQPNVYRKFISNLCRKADEKYNSGLFHFQKESGVSDLPDTITPKLAIDDKILKPIIQGLYFEFGSPYHFGVLPVEILGTVYERFLGKVIRLTAGHQAKVEEKPEVRKAGGVYYTPSYIVDYIVKNTVGKQTEGKSPAQIAKGKDGQPIRILDMACGSGSFLLGAYQYLLDHCQKWYEANDPEKHTKAVFQDTKGIWRLTISERKRILITHIYGVDIDRQAVEVTKLSLLIKALEGENDATLTHQMQLFQERALPNLTNNIKCGNSLIGPDYFSGTLFPDPEELSRINPFDWKAEFTEVMTIGGFDCVIGNPPYVRQELLGESKTYFQRQYAVFHGIADLYSYFIECGVSLLKEGGKLGFIVANKWMRTSYAKPLRSWLKNQAIMEITDFGDLPVFKTATTYPCILIIKKDKPRSVFMATQVKTLGFTNISEYVQSNRYEVNQFNLDDNGWSLSNERAQMLISKLRGAGVTLKEYVKGSVYYGIKTGLNAAFVIDQTTREKLVNQNAESEKLIKPFIIGREVKRYQPTVSESYLILIPRGWTREASVNSKDPWKWLENNYPAISAHLAPFAKDAEQRYDKGEYWWEMRACEYYAEFERPKIIYPNICRRPEFAYDIAKHYTNQKCFIIPLDDKYLLGILNSSVTNYLFKAMLPKLRGDFYEPSYVYLQDFPISSINLSDPFERAKYDKMVALVEQMLDLQKRKVEFRGAAEQQQVQRLIDSTDKQIDTLAYELYGLTQEEIEIVEAAVK